MIDVLLTNTKRRQSVFGTQAVDCDRVGGDILRWYRCCITGRSDQLHTRKQAGGPSRTHPPETHLKWGLVLANLPPASAAYPRVHTLLLKLAAVAKARLVFLAEENDRLEI